MRFRQIDDRASSSDLDPSFWVPFAKNSCYLSWKGIPIQKEPFQMVSTQQIILELKPATIIEFGSSYGGSALWLADIQGLVMQNGQVISVDINHDKIAKEAFADKRIRFIQGDLTKKIEDILTPKILADISYPLLFIEDSHVNTLQILEYFHQSILKAGDYMIIEDTNLDYYKACNRVRKKKFADDHPMLGKLKVLTDWLYNHKDSYLIDTKYTDLFGIMNTSKNWNSVIKRVYTS
jgi:cephalosporin hydroxylase